MYEPKFKLNHRDAARYHQLAVRDCVTGSLTGRALERAKRSRKYKPLTLEEQAELEALEKKFSAKIMSHPRYQMQMRRVRSMDRRLRLLTKKLQDQARASGQECNVYDGLYGKNKTLTTKRKSVKSAPMKHEL